MSSRHHHRFVGRPSTTYRTNKPQQRQCVHLRGRNARRLVSIQVAYGLFCALQFGHLLVTLLPRTSTAMRQRERAFSAAWSLFS
eukprot:998615-Amphidinium_carterae.1